MDSIVVGNDLPRYYSWVVTEGLNNVINMNQDRITFKITGYALNPNQIGDLIFWSKEKEVKDPIYAATPDTLIVNYTTKPSAVQDALTIAAAVVLPIVGGVWGVSHWLYLRRRKATTPP